MEKAMDSDEATRSAAAAASTAMKGFAQSTITVDNPADLYPLIGELLGSLRSLVQVADQLAHAHMRHRGRARLDDGDATLGAHEADGATWALVRARELLDAAEHATDLASQDSSRIAWVPAERNERWVSVVFLQGAEADEPLNLLDRSEASAAIRYLAQWDYGDETTEAALVNGYVYEGIPTCATDRAVEDKASGYAVIHNPTLGYVSLLRRFPQTSDEAAAPSAAVAPATPSRSAALHPWFSSRRSGDRSVVRSVAL
ncbi:hypothetical protein ABZ477_04010 [Microbacterium sp. NPDC019599]|uniref:hypothetical protein n=1 Tax=Microbacterium sp. NPDC019599 TaxID=3154690 RepID=UPI0033E1D4C5